MQIQADSIGTTVERSQSAQVTALGAAYLAGLGAGVWASLNDIKTLVRPERQFAPGAFDQALYERWGRAVELVKQF
jgi:glycerol kinase